MNSEDRTRNCAGLSTTHSRRLAGMLAILLVPVVGCDSLRIPDPDVIYIALGDSATSGPAERDYPDVLRERLDVPARELAKEATGGGSVSAARNTLNDLIADDIYPNARVLLLWSGGSDLIDFIGEVDPLLLWSVRDEDLPFEDELQEELTRIAGELRAIISSARSADLDVYVATYYPILGGFSSCDAMPFNILLPGQARRANEYVDLLNARIRGAVAAERAVLVDIAGELPNIADDRDNYANCNHLSSAGNILVADVFYDAIRAGGG